MFKLRFETGERAYETAHKLFNHLMQQPEVVAACRGRTGGYATLANRTSGKPYIAFLLGEVSVADSPKYFGNSLEKADRLSAYSDHVLSRQSRDPQNGKWAGAAKGADYIVSFSGLPEDIDEAFSLGLISLMGDLTLYAARSIAEEHGNKFFVLVEKLFGDSSGN